MEFFELPPPPEPVEHPAYEPPVWSGPPAGVAGASALAEPLELAATTDAAAVLERVLAYPNGFQLGLTLFARTHEVGQDIGQAQHPHHMPRRRSEPWTIPDEFLRFGIQYSDGSKVTNLDLLAGGPFAPELEEPSGPIMLGGGGGGGDRRYELGHWCWPRPPPGRMEFVCEWPAYGVALTRRDFDADAIIEAASRARQLWPE